MDHHAKLYELEFQTLLNNNQDEFSNQEKDLIQKLLHHLNE